MKLTQIMNENQENRPLSNEVKKHFLEIVSTYNKYQEMMDRKSDLATVAETLGGITEAARTLAIHEGDDWFDKHTIKRNMSELDKLGKEFDKCAKEATSLDQRLGGLYEDMGHILSRYYKMGEITEEQMKDRLGMNESVGCGCGGTTESTCGCGTHTHESVVNESLEFVVNTYKDGKSYIGYYGKNDKRTKFIPKPYGNTEDAIKVAKKLAKSNKGKYIDDFNVRTSHPDIYGKPGDIKDVKESVNEATKYKVIFAGLKEKDAKDFFTMVDGSPKIKAMTRDSGVFKVGNEVTIRFGVGSKQELELIKKVAKSERLKIVKIDESVNESASKEAMGIAGFTGTRGSAVQDFITKNELDGKKLFQYVKKGGLKQRMEFVSAIAGTPGNKIQKMIISKFKLGESVNEEKPGLWANIRAKQKRGEKPAHKNSQAHKDAVKAGKKINKEESVNEVSLKPKKLNQLKKGEKFVFNNKPFEFVELYTDIPNAAKVKTQDGKTSVVSFGGGMVNKNTKGGFSDYLKQGGRVWDNVNPTNSSSLSEAKFGYKDSTASYINNHKDEFKIAEKLNKGNEVKFYDSLSQMEEKIGHPKFMIFLSNALRGYKVDMYKDPKIKNPQDAQEALFLLSK